MNLCSSCVPELESSCLVCKVPFLDQGRSTDPNIVLIVGIFTPIDKKNLWLMNHFFPFRTEICYSNGKHGQHLQKYGCGFWCISFSLGVSSWPIWYSCIYPGLQILAQILFLQFCLMQQLLFKCASNQGLFLVIQILARKQEWNGCRIINQ